SRTLTLSGASSIATHGRLTLASTVVSGALAVGGTLQVNPAGSTIATLAPLTGSLVRVQSNGSGNATLTVTNGFTNHGPIELNGAPGFTSTLTVSNGTLVNASDGIVQSVPGTGGARTLAAELDNQGTVTVNSALTLTKSGAHHTNSSSINLAADLNVTHSGATPSFANSGTITCTTGDLTVSGGTGSFTNTGTLALAGRTLTVTDGAFNYNSGSITGSPGSMVFNTTCVATFTAGLPAVPATFTGATLAGPALTSAANLTLNAGTVSATSLTMASGHTLQVNPSGSSVTTLAPLAGSLVRVQS